jgi:MFS family permease
MLVWGWRIPFLLAFFTAVLGFVLRLGMPEPKAFLAAARAEKALLEGGAATTGAEGPVASVAVSGQLSTKDLDVEGEDKR